MKSVARLARASHNVTSAQVGLGAVLLVAAALLSAPQVAQAAQKASGSGARVDNCSWDRPGVNPFMGDVVGAVDRYKDIPQAVRTRLKERMADRNFDEFVTIGRDSIKGQSRYDARISEMHFGAGTVCNNVSRTHWNKDMEQAGLVYCEGEHCILVPTVCRNVSRIRRTESAVASTRASRKKALGPDDAQAASPLTFAENGGPASGDPVPGGRAAAALGGKGDGPSGAGYGDPGPRMGAVANFTSPFSGGYHGGSGPDGLTNPPSTLTPVTEVPEPQQWLLFGLGLLAVAYKRRR